MFFLLCVRCRKCLNLLRNGKTVPLRLDLWTCTTDCSRTSCGVSTLKLVTLIEVWLMHAVVIYILRVFQSCSKLYLSNFWETIHCINIYFAVSVHPGLFCRLIFNVFKYIAYLNKYKQEYFLTVYREFCSVIIFAVNLHQSQRGMQNMRESV